MCTMLGVPLRQVKYDTGVISHEIKSTVAILTLIFLHGKILASGSWGTVRRMSDKVTKTVGWLEEECGCRLTPGKPEKLTFRILISISFR